MKIYRKFNSSRPTLAKIKKVVMTLKNSKLPRPDKTATKLLKDAIEAISQPVANVFNASLATGTLPDI